MVKTSTLIVILGVFALSIAVFANEADGAGLVWRAVNKAGSLIADLGNVAGGCSDGQVLKWQSLNSTFICAADSTGSGAPTTVQYWVNAADATLTAEKVMLVKVKSADEIVNNSVILQNDDVLFFSIGANEVWYVERYLIIDMFALSDFQQTWTVPSGATFHGLPDDVNNLGSATGGATTVQTLLTTTRTKTIAANTVVTLIEHGIVINGGTAGTVQFQWSQAVAEVANTAVKKGSFLRATQLI